MSDTRLTTGPRGGREGGSESSTLEHEPANRSADGLFYAACERATEASKDGLRHTERVLLALQSTMELVEFGKERPDELEALLHYHKSRQGLDVVGRLVKLIFPHAGAPLRNCYANALRHVERHGQTAEQLPAFLRQIGIEKAARTEVKAGKEGQGTKPAPEFQRVHVDALPGAPKDKATFTPRGWQVERCEKGFDILIPKEKAPRGRKPAAAAA